jgi:hypothetical protein
MTKSWRIALVVGAIVAVCAAGSAGAAKFITGGDIKNGSIGLKDLSSAARRALAGRAGAAGPAGAAGAQGPTGPQGPAGPSSLATFTRTQEFVAPANDFAEGEVRCPAGMVATGGSVSVGALEPVFDAPSGDGRGWIGSAFDSSGLGGFRMLVTVICTPGSASPFAVAGAHATPDALKAAFQAARD